MHHKEIAELYELENEDPTLVDASFLQKLGFPTKGDTYLCFRLKEIKSKDAYDIKYQSRQYAPYFTTLEESIKNEFHD